MAFNIKYIPNKNRDPDQWTAILSNDNDSELIRVTSNSRQGAIEKMIICRDSIVEELQQLIIQ